MNSVTRVLKHGGIVACYGSTSGVDVQIGMGAILKNLEFKGPSFSDHAFRVLIRIILTGATMGSLEEFKKAVAFIDEKKINPIVHTVLQGLEKAEEGFEIMKQGGQFGKVSSHIILERGVR